MASSPRRVPRELYQLGLSCRIRRVSAALHRISRSGSIASLLDWINASLPVLLPLYCFWSTGRCGTLSHDRACRRYLHSHRHSHDQLRHRILAGTAIAGCMYRYRIGLDVHADHVHHQQLFRIKKSTRHVIVRIWYILREHHYHSRHSATDAHHRLCMDGQVRHSGRAPLLRNLLPLPETSLRYCEETASGRAII